MRQLPEAFRSVQSLEPRDLWELIGPRLVDSVYEPSIDRLEREALSIAVAALRASGRRMRDSLVFDQHSFRRLESAVFRIPERITEVSDVSDR
jgi:hypothetical protein